MNTEVKDLQKVPSDQKPVEVTEIEITELELREEFAPSCCGGGCCNS